jgi:hypothetical protein
MVAQARDFRWARGVRTFSEFRSAEVRCRRSVSLECFVFRESSSNRGHSQEKMFCDSSEPGSRPWNRRTKFKVFHSDERHQIAQVFLQVSLCFTREFHELNARALAQGSSRGR